MADFTGWRVLVAGASRGIGRAIAEGFARAGAAIAISARGEAGLDAAATALRQHGGLVDARVCDLADGTAIARWVGEAAAALGGIDVLVSNASAAAMGGSDEAWSANFTVDVLGAVRLTRAAEAALAASGRGSVLYISSISGLGPSLRSPAYAAAKAALNNLTISQALALAPQRVRVNAILPGSILFPGGTWEQRQASDPALYTRTLERIPFGRFGTVEEISEPALFLASPAARWITGQTLAIDGGQALA
ncbi:MAG: SDR family oxidoreductase [Alphaproteobacteria bacterium]|nr:MAG: SDR family oxidoreductase [Alphaproteobacteria bacterium]